VIELNKKMGEPPRGRWLNERTVRPAGLGGIDRAVIRIQEVLADGQEAGTGLDVFWAEPPDHNDPMKLIDMVGPALVS